MQFAQDAYVSPINARQKKAVANAITQLLGNPHAIKELDWAWDRIAVTTVTGSSFDQLHRPANICLSRLTRRPEMRDIRTAQSIPLNAIFLVNSTGRLYYSYRNINSSGDFSTVYFSPRDITEKVLHIAGIKKELSLLADMAKLTGGWVTSGDTLVLGQWLRVQGLALPGHLDEASDLLELLELTDLPDSPRYGNYWQLLDAPEHSPYRLTEQNRAIIRQVNEELTEGAASLVAGVGLHLILESASADQLPTSQSYRLQRLIEIAVWASEQGQAYLERLGWFTDENGPKATPVFIEQLLIAAMLLDLDPDIDRAHAKFAGFELYSEHYRGLHPARVRAALEAHLIEKMQLDRLLAPLVAELVLAGMAPEYLFDEWPSTLKMGTPAWVVGTQAVHFVEALIPGGARRFSYPQLLAFSRLAKVTPTLASVQAASTVDPVLTWALMNEIIRPDATGSLDQKAIELAVNQYQQYVELTLTAAQYFAAPVPHRKPLALKALTSSVPDCNPDELLVKLRGTGGGAGRKVSVLDLYMGDELHTEDWDRLRGASIYESFPGLSRLYPANDLYEEAINRHYSGLTTALSNNIEVMLSQLPPGDSPFIEYGALGIYCVERYTTTRPPETPNPRWVFQPGIPHPGETGRFGVIICAQLYSHIRCFEVFPLRLQCRSSAVLDDLFAHLVSINPGDGSPTFVQKHRIDNLQLDVQAYLQNQAPRDGVRSRLFIRKIGEFAASTQDADASYPNPYFRSPRKQALSQLIAEQNPYLTVDELKRIGLDQTSRERAIEKTDAIFNTLLNLIIPFKECIEEMSSGNGDRQRKAIFGCVMDVAVIAMTFAAVPGKIAISSAKATTAITRLLSSSRVLANTAISLFNPLSGLPHLLKDGGKLFGRGLAKLSDPLLSTTRLARRQLHQLTGSNSYDLLKAIDHTGAGTPIRLSLDTVAHARAVFKSDGIDSAEQILKHLHANPARPLKNIPEQELSRLLEDSLAEIARKSDASKWLDDVLDGQTIDSLIRQQAKKYSLDNLHQFDDHLTLPELFESTLQVEYKNLTAMRAHQQTILTGDLSKAPFNGIADELSFNPTGLTAPIDRATAWLLTASTSRNELDTVRNLLVEYSANAKPLNDPAVYTELHRRIAPADPGGLRSPTAQARYPSNVSGAALLEKHMAQLDPQHPDFARQMLAAMLGYHSFVDGNGRTARAIYAIDQLRKGRFEALSHLSENALSGLG